MRCSDSAYSGHGHHVGDSQCSCDNDRGMFNHEENGDENQDTRILAVQGVNLACTCQRLWSLKDEIDALRIIKTSSTIILRSMRNTNSQMYQREHRSEECLGL